jgi:G3E family GTPase
MAVAACACHVQTTLVRYILNERHGFRIAVILNEYGGETGLESVFVQDEQVRLDSTS